MLLLPLFLVYAYDIPLYLSIHFLANKQTHSNDIKLLRICDESNKTVTNQTVSRSVTKECPSVCGIPAN